MAMAGVLAVMLLLVVATAARAEGPPPTRLLLAGCDANTPIARLLARAFRGSHPHVVVDVQSIGSTNGVALAAAGAIHIGLTSRPLREQEQHWGLTYLPYALTAVVIGADPEVAQDGLAASDLIAIYRGSQSRWRNGSEIALFAREVGDSSVAELKTKLPGFADAYEAGARTHHWRVVYTEMDMHEALVSIRFALGLSDLGTITIERLPIKALRIEGIAPTVESLAEGHYRFTKTLSFVFRNDALPPAARAFLEFVRSEQGERILTAHGYLPAR